MANTPRQDTLAAFASITAKIAELSADIRPSYTVDGVTVDRMAMIERLTTLKQQMLKEQPGLDAELQPVFQVNALPGDCY